MDTRSATSWGYPQRFLAVNTVAGGLSAGFFLARPRRQGEKKGSARAAFGTTPAE